LRDWRSVAPQSGQVAGWSDTLFFFTDAATRTKKSLQHSSYWIHYRIPVRCYILSVCKVL